ncbi:MAG: PAS domain S-box protein [Anaerolineales bacterium]|nr:PAS domain S-box protein [Anaerolineales bacterium]
MKDKRKTKAQLSQELTDLRQQMAQLEAAYQRLDAAWHESDERFRHWSEATFEGLAVHEQGQILEANPKLAEIFGYELPEFIGKQVSELIAPESRDQVLTKTLSGTQERYEAVGLRKDGVVFPIEISEKLIPYQAHTAKILVIRDITEQKRAKAAYKQAVIYAHELRSEINERKRAEALRNELEQQFRQVQKMEAIGRLAGGVAHDFNNLLTAIMGYTAMAADTLPPDHAAHPDLEGIQKTAQRAANLTRQLLAFARRQIIEPRILNLNDLILNVEKMLRRLISEDIKLTTLLAPDLASLKADPGQLEQVLLNLVVNARDAMPNGGELIIETANVSLDHDYARRHAEVTPGEYVLLAVSDTGVGMTEEVKSRLFEPFFTTKEVGKGTGLGLATCFGIVKQNGGHIRAYSEVGVGTTFKIYLPQVEGVATPLVRPEPINILAQGTETILLAEDEITVRDLAAQSLRQQGYTVLEAADGLEALELAQSQPKKEIHLLLTDMIMPRLGGANLAEQLRAARPQIKVLFMSGYTDSTIIRYGLPKTGSAFLQKPFSPQRLVQKVREVLDIEEKALEQT